MSLNSCWNPGNLSSSGTTSAHDAHSYVTREVKGLSGERGDTGERNVMDVAASALLLGGMVGVVSSTLGAGGSVLTIPILIYLMGTETHDAVATALVVVTLTALVAVCAQFRLRLINIHVGLPFAIAGIPGAVVGSWISGNTANSVLLSLYALLLLLVAGWVLVGQRGASRHKEAVPPPRPTGIRTDLLIGIAGCLAGALTGFFGVGGGFVKVPLLMFVGRLPIHQAVGTSLFVMVITAGTSVFVHLQFSTPDWEMVSFFAASGMVGALLGSLFMARISGAALQTGFGFALVALALVMLVAL